MQNLQARKIADQHYAVRSAFTTDPSDSTAAAARASVDNVSVSTTIATRRQRRKRARKRMRELRMFRMAGFLLGYFTLSWLPFVVYEFACIANDCDVNKYIRCVYKVCVWYASCVFRQVRVRRAQFPMYITLMQVPSDTVPPFVCLLLHSATVHLFVVTQCHRSSAASLQLGRQRLGVRLSSARIPRNLQTRLPAAAVLQEHLLRTPLCSSVLLLHRPGYAAYRLRRDHIQDRLR